MSLNALRFSRPRRSNFEIDRLHDVKARRQVEYLGVLLSIRLLKACLVSALLAVLLVVKFGVWLGLLASVLLILLSVVFAKLPLVKRPVQGLYKKHEAKILDFIERYIKIFRYFAIYPETTNDIGVDSIEHLRHLIESADKYLDNSAIRMTKAATGWHGLTAGSVITPIEKVDTVNHTELLGPLVLDSLHKTGHSVFPVVHDESKNVVGVLDIRDMLDVSSKQKSLSASDQMNRDIVKVSSDTSLADTIDKLLGAASKIVFVTGDTGDIVGIVTLGDLIDSLLGKTGVK